MPGRDAKPRLVPTFAALGFAGYPVISFLPEFMGVNGRAITVPFRVLILALAATVLVQIATGQHRGYVGKLTVPLAIFWTLYLLSMLRDVFLDPVRLSLPGQEYFYYGFGTSLLPMLAFFVLQSKHATLRSLKFTLVLMTVGCILGVGNNIDRLGQTAFRFDANPSLNTISFGHLGASVAGLSLMLVLQGQRSVFPRWILIVLGTSGLLTVALAGSRGPVIALAVMLGVTFLACVRRGRGLQVVLFVSVLALTIPRILEEPTRLTNTLVTRLSAIGEDNSSNVRTKLWQDAWDQFIDNPLGGGGLEVRHALTYPHNVVLESLMATGFVGGLSFLVMIAMGLIYARRLIVTESPFGWLGLLLIQRVVAGMFSGALYASSDLWYLLASVAAAHYVARNAPSPDSPGYDHNEQDRANYRNSDGIDSQNV